MNIDLENLRRLTDLIDSIGATTRSDLMELKYSPEELKERRDLFERLTTATRVTYNYLTYVVDIYEQSDPLLFLREMEAKEITPGASSKDLATYKDLLNYTGEL